MSDNTESNERAIDKKKIEKELEDIFRRLIVMSPEFSSRDERKPRTPEVTLISVPVRLQPGTSLTESE